MNTVEQLQFLARFARLDLNHLREGDWLNLKDDLSQFLPKASEGTIVFDIELDPEAAHYPKPKIVSLQKEVKAIVPKYLIGGDWASTPSVEIKTAITYELLPGGVFCAHGSFRDMFLQSIINIMANPAEASKVNACPECGAIFARVRRQKYCSGPCVDAANKRTWLKTKKGQRYLKNLKKKREGKK